MEVIGGFVYPFILICLQLDEVEDTPIQRARMNTMSSPRRTTVPAVVASSHVPPSPPQVSTDSLAQGGREGGREWGCERERSEEGQGEWRVTYVSSPSLQILKEIVCSYCRNAESMAKLQMYKAQVSVTECHRTACTSDEGVSREWLCVVFSVIPSLFG